MWEAEVAGSMRNITVSSCSFGTLILSHSMERTRMSVLWTL